MVRSNHPGSERIRTGSGRTAIDAGSERHRSDRWNLAIYLRAGQLVTLDRGPGRRDRVWPGSETPGRDWPPTRRPVPAEAAIPPSGRILYRRMEFTYTSFRFKTDRHREGGLVCQSIESLAIRARRHGSTGYRQPTTRRTITTKSGVSTTPETFDEKRLHHVTREVLPRTESVAVNKASQTDHSWMEALATISRSDSRTPSESVDFVTQPVVYKSFIAISNRSIRSQTCPAQWVSPRPRVS